ncbi:MAG: nicotinate (nicotinamide) nucleotide adenylyltransferase [Solirubrobacterales bacterium]
MLGGAFNPPHIGHLLLAREAMRRMGLEKVMLVPTGKAAHKEIEDEPGAEVRLRMSVLAAEGEAGVEVSPIEVEREGPSYTYETLEQLYGADPGRELVLLMGADVAAGLPQWERPERVIELARLGIAMREGSEPAEVAVVLESLGAAGRAEMIDMPRCEVSSTMVRERAAAGQPLQGLVSPPVAELIEREGLYR